MQSLNLQTPPDAIQTETASPVDGWVMPTVTSFDQGVSLMTVMWNGEKNADTLNGFRYGAVGYVTAKIRRDEVANFQSADWDDILSTVANKTRIGQDTPIQSKEVSRRIRCYVLRERMAGVAGRDVAECLSFNETRDIVSKALNFDPANVDGSIREGWVDFFKGIYALRSAPNGRVTYDDFTNSVKATEKRIQASKDAKVNPDEAARKASEASVKAEKIARSKVSDAIVDGINTALTKKLLTPGEILGTFERVATQHGHSVESATIGFDPVNCTVTDCRKLVQVMFKAGKLEEMRLLIDSLSKAVASMERGDKPAESSKPSKFKPSKVKADPIPVPVPA